MTGIEGKISHYGHEVIANRFMRFPGVLARTEGFLKFLLASDPEWNPVASYEEYNNSFEALVAFPTTINNKYYAEYAVTGAQCVFTFLDAFKLEVDPDQYLSYSTVGLDSNMWITKSVVGSFTVLHADESATIEDPVYTVMTYLNEDYEGGDLYFPDLDYTVKPSAGDVFIFASHYLHGAHPVLSGTKYLNAFRMTATNILG